MARIIQYVFTHLRSYTRIRTHICVYLYVQKCIAYYITYYFADELPIAHVWDMEEMHACHAWMEISSQNTTFS